MRAFIAIDLPEDTRRALADFAGQLRTHKLHAAWASPRATHLTLRFLGDINDTQAARLREQLLPRYAEVGAPRLLVRGVGAFPSLRKPAVLWAGVQTVSDHLYRLYQVAETAATRIGIPPADKTFHPHVTLARIRRREHRAAFARVLEAYCVQENPLEFGEEFSPASVLLFKSTLTPQGAVYQVMQEFSLK